MTIYLNKFEISRIEYFVFYLDRKKIVGSEKKGDSDEGTALLGGNMGGCP